MIRVFAVSAGCVSGLVSGVSADNAVNFLLSRNVPDVLKQQGEANVRLIELTKVKGQNEYKLSVIA